LRSNCRKPSQQFLRPNCQKPSPPVLRPNRRKPSEWFWGQTTHKTVAIGFEVQTDEKPSTLVLRLNQEIRAPHLHMHGVNCTRCHPTSWSLGHWVPDLCDHPRSSASGLLLLSWSSSLHIMPHLPPTHHEISKHDSLNETKIKEK
jgi:hypothetical protein